MREYINVFMLCDIDMLINVNILIRYSTYNNPKKVP